MKAIVTDSWAGRRCYAVEIVGETPKRYRVKVLQDTWLPGNRRLPEGSVTLVPKTAVRDAPGNVDTAYKDEVTMPDIKVNFDGYDRPVVDGHLNL